MRNGEDMITQEDIKKKIVAIEGMIAVATKQLEEAENTEQMITAQYLINEYEGMLEDTKQFYNI